MEMKFAERLKKLREDLGISQRELARRAGISSAMISLYEAGKKSPTIDVLMKLAVVLEVSADYLLGLTDDPSPKSGKMPDYLKEKLEECEKYERLLKELKSRLEDV